MYAPEKNFPVYCSACWWSDKWNPLTYGADYDFGRPFFVQFRELLGKVPRPNLRCTNTVNSDYCNYVADSKNCYLCFGSIEVEDCLYGCPYESKFCVDTYLARECEYCYECIDCEKLSRCAFAQDCSSSLNLLCCYDCKNCQDCIGCAGLRNKKHHIYNREYSPAEYAEKLKVIRAGGRLALSGVRQEFERLKLAIPHRFTTTLQCAEVSGDHIVQSKNAKECFDVKRAEDCRYDVRLIDAKDTQDSNYCEYLELCYEHLGFWKMSRSICCNTTGECADAAYGDFCSGSTNIFGCVGLKNQNCCIFNKQYSKADYLALRERIVEHMSEMPYTDRKGRVYSFGDYTPIELSLFAYNESTAQDYFPLTKSEAEAAGYPWRETEEKHYQITLPADQIPNTIREVPDAIMDQVLGCANAADKYRSISPWAAGCTRAFKIIPAELQFYRQMQLPLPTLCPNCRHYARLAERNPFRLWSRHCMCSGARINAEADDPSAPPLVKGRLSETHQNTVKHFHGDSPCPNEFETAYAPDRPEIIYCEQCYNSEVV